MSRKKLSEYRAKSLLFAALDQQYMGVELDGSTDWQAAIAALPDDRYVLKVDQAEKGRFKKGLVKLDRSPTELAGDAKELFDKGYRFLLVEPYRQHEAEAEQYFAMARTRDGLQVSYSKAGGVDVEDQAGSMLTALYQGGEINGVSLDAAQLEALARVFEANYFSFLEINPLLVTEGTLNLLDAAVEVDDEAQFFEDGWGREDLRQPLSRTPTPEEAAVRELADNSQASFSLEVLNPDGAIFLLLSGGGASVTVADEVHNLGYGDQLANYGEYSGNPNREETRIYTEQIIRLLLKSKATGKVLIIAGGVANFTDVRATFAGVIDAFKQHQDELHRQGVKVYVRRGGPHEKEGLAAMRDYLESAGLLGEVAGPELQLSDIVARALHSEVAA
jgi:succinyl-CoA synthetase beta subunit